MYKKGKFNFLLVISFVILLLFLIYHSYIFFRNERSLLKKEDDLRELCLNRTDESPSEKFCEMIIQEEEHSKDFYTIFLNIFIVNINFFGFLLFLFVVIPSCYFICKYFKNKVILSDITRCSYKKIIFGLFRNAYKCIWIFPVLVIIAYIISYMYTKNFDPVYAVQSGHIGWKLSTVCHPVFFLIMYLVNIVIHSTLYVNISLCVARKYQNYFICVILSFLCFIGIEVFLEVVFAGLISDVFFHNYDIGLIFNIVNMFAFNDVNGVFFTMSVPFVIMILSFFVLFLLYKNKESLVIDCEKND